MQSKHSRSIKFPFKSKKHTVTQNIQKDTGDPEKEELLFSLRLLPNL